MARKSKTEKANDLLSQARKRFDFAEKFESENREEARIDLEFLAGEQWTEEARTARKNRPMLTINRMPQFVRQVLGDLKQSRPSIKVHPVDSGADTETAEIYQGLIRNIEICSDAKEAYYTASENQVAAGEGYWRVITDYAEGDAFEQDIRIEKIVSPFAVTMDPHAKKQTGEDAKWCFVTERMSLDDFKTAYPNASTTSFDDQHLSSELTNWYDGNSIRIAEYWYCEEKPRLLGLLQDGQVIDLTDVEMPPELPIIRTRKATKKCWYRVVINGAEVLEEPKEWPGAFLPVVRLLGEQINLGERMIRHGVIRHARDAQRMYNYWRSAQTESVALQPKAPYLADIKQIEGFERYWGVANTANLPYLPYDSTKGSPGSRPVRDMPPQGSTGMAQEIALAAEDMKATTGIYDAALGNRSNETSGKAILARQKESDVGTYTYFDNLGRAVQYTGKILIDLIPRIYDTERVVRVIGEDEGEKMVTINKTLPTGETINDLTVGKYDLTVTMGPSYSTMRQEAAEGMLNAVNANPQLWGVIGDLLAKNLDWPGADDMAERMKKMLPPQLQEDDDSPEGQQQAQMRQQMTQQQQQMQEMMARLTMMEKQASIEKDRASAAKVMAEINKTRADTENIQADMLKTLSEIPGDQGESAFGVPQ